MDPQGIVDRNAFVRAFRESAPYIHYLHGKIVVLAFDSGVIESSAFPALADDVLLMGRLGSKIVVCFEIRGLLEGDPAVGSRFVRGVRVTDYASLRRMREVCGRMQYKLMSAFSAGYASASEKSSIATVVSGNFALARPMGVIDGVDMGYAGAVRSVAADKVRRLLDDGCIVVAAPLGFSIGGRCYNVSMPDLASALASGLNADKLVYLGEDEGLRRKGGGIASNLTLDELADRDAFEPVSAELARFLPAAESALRSGVPRAQIVSGRSDGALFAELYTREGAGTSIKLSSFSDVAPASPDDAADLARLIAPAVRDGLLLPRDAAYVESRIEDFFLLRYDGAARGCVELKRFDDDPRAMELGCLVVSEDSQSQGDGNKLLAFAMERARRLGAVRLFALTARAEDWFRENGFRPSSACELPPSRQRVCAENGRHSKVFVMELGERESNFVGRSEPG